MVVGGNTSVTRPAITLAMSLEIVAAKIAVRQFAVVSQSLLAAKSTHLQELALPVAV